MAVTIAGSFKLLHDRLIQFRPVWKKYLPWGGAIAAIVFLLLSFQVGRKIMPALHFSFDPELKEIGQIVSRQRRDEDRFYQLAWPVGDTLSFYANQPIATIAVPVAGETRKIDGPFFLFMQTELIPIFSDEQGKIAADYANMRVKYRSDRFVLLYSNRTIEIGN